MKLKIPRIDSSVSAASDVPGLFGRYGVKFGTLDAVNWPSDFPYKPEVHFAFAHDTTNLYIHYKVVEDSLKGDFTDDFSNVWEDSCCELFIAPADDGLYYNLEFGCAGALYFCVGGGRRDRERAPRAAMDSILRWTSLGRRIVGSRSGMQVWESALVVPSDAFWMHKPDFRGAGMRGNVYKCGNTEHKHFVSFAPIETPSPDFHRPEYFCNIEFE